MTSAIETFRAEIPTQDTSSFSFDKRSKEARENADNNALTIESLCSRFEELKAQGLGDRTEEGQELRAAIRSFIEQEKLPVRVTRSTTNDELLDMIEDALGDRSIGDAEPPVDEEEPGTAAGEQDENEQPMRRRR